MKEAKGKETHNLALWNAFCTTPPDFTKQFTRAGGFSGTSINPTYAVRKLTEVFGPEGFGWGREEVGRELIPVPGSGELLVYIAIRLWYLYDEERRFVGPQWGGDKVLVARRDGAISADDEAFKKASTDGFLKCASFLGVGGDVHLGCYDDSKYINSIKAEAAASPAPAKPVVLEEKVGMMNKNWQDLRIKWKSQGMEEDQIKKNAESFLRIWDKELTDENPEHTRTARQEFIIKKQKELLDSINNQA